MSLPTPLWPLRCLCRCELSTRPTKVPKAKAKGKNSSRKATEALSDDDDMVALALMVAAAKPARDDLGQQLCLMPGYLAKRADQVVKASLAKKDLRLLQQKVRRSQWWLRTLRGPRSPWRRVPLYMHPLCRYQMHPTKKVDHTPVVPACPHPCGACRFRLFGAFPYDELSVSISIK